MSEDNYFYRYLPVLDDKLERIEKSIVHSVHYFSSPSSFNDPFDCSTPVVFDGSDAQLRDYYRAVFSRQDQNLTEQEIDVLVSRIMSDFESDPRSSIPKESIQTSYRNRVVDNYGVLCVSESGDHPLMWSHYANSHKGICLVLNRKSLMDIQIGGDAVSALSRKFFCYKPYRVNYENSRPHLNFLADDTNAKLNKTMFTKSAHWSYEKEWRILITGGAKTYQLPNDVLTGIILGVNISHEHREKINEWALLAPSKPWVRQATLSNTDFSIFIE
jgi:hypothetical protein